MLKLKSNRYLIISAIATFFVVAGLLLLYRSMTINSLVSQEERASVNLAFVLSHVLLPDYQDFLEVSGQTPAEALKASAKISALDELVKSSIIGTNVVKVLIINKQGRVLYSSNPQQIGTSKLESSGFQGAMAGTPTSVFSFRDNFSGAHAVYSDRNIVSTYIPVKARHSEELFGTFEIYSDVTDLVAVLSRSQLRTSIGVLFSMLVIYAILFAVARRADELFYRQQLQRQEHEAKIRHHEYHDSLTKLPNRTGFLDRLDEAIHQAKRQGGIVGIMFVGVDRFKLVNDSLGHHAGDELLRVIAKRLQGVVRESDLLFRVGGDEFAIIPQSVDSHEGLTFLARRVLTTIKSPLEIGGQPLIPTASIGISLYPQDDNDAAQLIKNADSAMRLAKQSGRNQYSYYTPEMNSQAAEKLSFETALQQALARDEFFLQYQPRVNNVDGSMVSMEALLRWRRADGEVVLPGAFIDILEDRDLILEVGAWVLTTVARQMRSWLEQGYEPMRISVNVSSRQFRSRNFVSMLQDIMQTEGVSPDYLELELTESLLVENADQAIEVMRELKQLGVKLSIDDFGTGYSSLTYLKLLPIDYLKIDRSFINDVTTNEKDEAIINTITTLARELHIGVVAEGVETEAQWQILKTKYCHELQGFYFSRPLDVGVISDMLHRKRHVSGQ